MERGFKWMGDYEITADEVLGGIAPKANKLEQAKQLLRELAETSNAVQSNEILIWLMSREFQRGHWKMQRSSLALGQRKSTIHGTGNWAE